MYTVRMRFFNFLLCSITDCPPYVSSPFSHDLPTRPAPRPYACRPRRQAARALVGWREKVDEEWSVACSDHWLLYCRLVGIPQCSSHPPSPFEISPIYKIAPRSRIEWTIGLAAWSAYEVCGQRSAVSLSVCQPVSGQPVSLSAVSLSACQRSACQRSACQQSGQA